MAISKIGQLFVSNADSVLQRRPSRAKGPDTQPQHSSLPRSGAGNSATDDAVVISPTIRNTAGQSSADLDPDRAARVEQLKGRVRNGTYTVDSGKVAVAVVKELI
jgi:flagellar biosynthesis anti-sigma factor FlgM